ncbi:hypothetical protein MHYP_G00206890 [Metynnis hypsauchen]
MGTITSSLVSVVMLLEHVYRSYTDIKTSGLCEGPVWEVQLGQGTLGSGNFGGIEKAERSASRGNTRGERGTSKGEILSLGKSLLNIKVLWVCSLLCTELKHSTSRLLSPRLLLISKFPLRPPDCDPCPVCERWKGQHRSSF